MCKTSWLASVAILSVAVPMATNAQEREGSSAADAGQPGEIIVTAQKRSENVQRVPVTVSVISDQVIQQRNIATTSDLVQAVPDLGVTQFGVFQVRGIGTQGFTKSAEQSVSTVIDGIAQARPSAFQLANGLYDVDHVEVLAGPQGTLFGRNASAGVINIVTKSPQLGKFEVIGHGDIANKDYINASLVLNIPVGDNAALRVVGHHSQFGKLVYNTFYNKWDHSSDDGIRARFLWEPTDDLKISLIGDYQWIDSNGINGIADYGGYPVYSRVTPAGESPTATAQTEALTSALLAGCGITPSPTNNKVCSHSLIGGPVYEARRRGISAQIDWDLSGDLSLTSVTGYRHDVTGSFNPDSGNQGGSWNVSLPINFFSRNINASKVDSFSQELRVQSPAVNRFNYTLGLYFSYIHDREFQDQAGGFASAPDTSGLPGYPDDVVFRRLLNQNYKSSNVSAFGQVNYRITEELQLLLGARVTRDHLNFFTYNSFPDSIADGGKYIYTGNTGFYSFVPVNSCSAAGGNPDDPTTCPAGTSLNDPAKVTTWGFTGKIGLQYQITPLTMIYGTYTRGYKGPYFQDQSSWPINIPLLVKSEKPDAFEIGVKTRLFDRLNVSLAAFTTKVKNFQTTIFVPPPVNCGTQCISNFIQGNVPYAVTRGIDLGVIGSFGKNFTFSGSALYNDSRFSKGFQVACRTGLCEARRQMPFAPKWKLVASGEYHVDVNDGVEAYAQADVTYTSSFPYASNPYPASYDSGARTVLGGRLGLRIDDGKYGVSVFCRNCTNRHYPIMSQPLPLGAIEGDVHYIGLGFYRQIGLSMDARF